MRLRGVAVHTLDPVTYQQAAGPGCQLRAPGHHLERLRADRPGRMACTTGTRRGWPSSTPRSRSSTSTASRCCSTCTSTAGRRTSPPLQRGGRANGIPHWVYHGRRFPLTVAGREQAQAAIYTDRRATQLYSRLRGDAGPALPGDAERDRLRDPERAAAGQPAPAHLGDAADRALAGAGAAPPSARSTRSARSCSCCRRAPTCGPCEFTPLEHLGMIALDVHDYYAGTGTRYRTTLQGGTYRGTLANQAELPGADGIDRPHLGRPADRGRVGCVLGRARGRPLSAADGDPVPAGRPQLVALEPRPQRASWGC